MPDVKRKMVTGFNHNIRHNGKIYHIQTEDSGMGSPHVITHLFLGGNILASKKTSYVDLAGADNLTSVVRELMEEQHKEVLRNLVNGVYDIVPTSAPNAQAKAAPSVSITSPVIQPARPTVSNAPPPLPTAAQRQEPPSLMAQINESLFGEDLISEKSLDEVILSYLAEDTEGKSGQG